MEEIGWRMTLEVFAIAMLVVAAAFLGLFFLQRRKDEAPGLLAHSAGSAVFLFDGEHLLDATAEARHFLTLSPLGAERGSSWARLMDCLAPKFPECGTHLRHLEREGAIELHAPSGLTLRAEQRGGLTRIAIEDTDSGDPLARRAQNEELTQLRAATAAAPFMIWREDAEARVTWASAAYLATAANIRPGAEIGWPLPRIFGDAVEGRTRLDVESGDGWFDLRHYIENGERLSFALPIDRAVEAERNLDDFRQTLTRTFADLPIGLAIFDRQRNLTLFNPALLDLIGLPFDFLSRRPKLFAFLDAMRERSMIPEPKDYRVWRSRMSALEEAAASGCYEEVWSLASGHTYRVIGRPHPNGALALMFEDISPEMSRTRRYRADLELGQSVIDAMDEAVAVFSRAGTLVMSNAAYSTLWRHDPAATLADEGIVSLCGHWRDGSAPTNLWGAAEHFVATLGPREAETGQARLLDGRLLNCRFTPLSGGATLIGFRIATEDRTPELVAV